MDKDITPLKKINPPKDIEKEEWYEALVDDLISIVTEAVFTSRWALVEGYWRVGERIREDDNVKKLAGNKKYSKELTKLLQRIAVKVNLSERTFWYALQTYDKFPQLDLIPEGKNITWHKLITKYLPAFKGDEVIEPLPEGVFDVIYADPPWEYDFSQSESRSIEDKYPTLSIEEIKNFTDKAGVKVQEKFADNAVLFLWATAPKIREALEVMVTWGFEYKSHAIWDKEIVGMGYWFRGQHELLLVGTKGSFPPPEESKRVSSVFRERRGEHSAKPELFYKLVEGWYPEGKYLELFARKERPGWEVYGNEV